MSPLDQLESAVPLLMCLPKAANIQSRISAPVRRAPEERQLAKGSSLIRFRNPLLSKLVGEPG